MKDDYLKLITSLIGLVISLGALSGFILNLSVQPQLLQIAALLGYVIFSGGILWFSLKRSEISLRWRWTSLAVLYVATILFFIWVGTWLTPKMTTSIESPSAQIVEPIDGKTVPFHTQLMLRYNNIPADHYLWVVVQVPRDNQIYLWQSDELQAQPKKNGALSATLQIGSENSKGDIFNIVTLLVDEKVNFTFQEDVRRCTNTGQCSGIPLPEAGVQILDFSTVVRE